MASHGYEKQTKSKLVKIEHAAGHKLGAVVPWGGSNCAKCEYRDGQDCKSRVFQKWNGSKVIPAAVEEYCCDEFETKKGGK